MITMTIDTLEPLSGFSSRRDLEWYLHGIAAPWVDSTLEPFEGKPEALVFRWYDNRRQEGNRCLWIFNTGLEAIMVEKLFLELKAKRRAACE